MSAERTQSARAVPGQREKLTRLRRAIRDRRGLVPHAARFDSGARLQGRHTLTAGGRTFNPLVRVRVSLPLPPFPA